MSGPKWDGKLYLPVKFREGAQPGTVEWEHERRRRRERAQRVREYIAERERNGKIRPRREPLSYAGWHWSLWRAITKLFKTKLR